jgi:hypothetical protein
MLETHFLRLDFAATFGQIAGTLQVCEHDDQNGRSVPLEVLLYRVDIGVI